MVQVLGLLSPCPEIPPACATAAHTCLDDQRDDGASCRNPHESKHLVPNVCFDIELVDACECHLQNHKDRRGKDSCNRNEERVEKSEDSDEQRHPPAIDGEYGEENEDKGQASASEEEPKHPSGCNSEYVKVRCRLCWKSN